MTEVADELYSLLVPLVGKRLIVPRVCVAEVTGLGQLQLLDEPPEWLVGKVGWKGVEVPLVSFEAAAGGETPQIGVRTRAVIFHASSGLQGGYFALMSQGLPQLVRINAEVVDSDETEDWADTAPIICRIQMINEYPFVPDLERLEGMLADSINSWR